MSQVWFSRNRAWFPRNTAIYGKPKVKVKGEFGFQEIELDFQEILPHMANRKLRLT